ncbi:MAG: hypothetical protein ISR75_01040 [Phycisphaerales bacterium]|nr:hypothetical protein [Planctomycetota bacterium]MBL6997009.1 hypothetical protein [Phycisphaerales bacterium]
MNTTTDNPNGTNLQTNCVNYPPKLDFTLCIDVTKTTAGWCVDISSLSPCASISGCTLKDLLEESAILCGKGDSKTFGAYDDALAHIATVFAQYGEHFLGERVSPPELGLVDRLLDRTGFLSISSAETDVFSTFIDVGIATSNKNEPSDITAIYDIFSDTWHSD